MMDIIQTRTCMFSDIYTSALSMNMFSMIKWINLNPWGLQIKGFNQYDIFLSKCNFFLLGLPVGLPTLLVERGGGGGYLEF